MAIRVDKKGKNEENNFAKKLKHIFPAIRTTRSSQAYDGGLDLYETEPFGFECKAVKSLDAQTKYLLYEWYNECVSDCKAADSENYFCTYPVILYKPYNARPHEIRTKGNKELVVMSYEDYKELTEMYTVNINKPVPLPVPSQLTVSHNQKTYNELIKKINRVDAIIFDNFFYICFFDDFIEHINDLISYKIL